MTKTPQRPVNNPRDTTAIRTGSRDVWLRTIALLGPQTHALTYSSEENALRPHAPIVSIIERPAASMAVVSWRDATCCRYGAQVWTLGAAREPGICALTGKPIAPAQLVFRPQRSRPVALNAKAMILASAMDAVSIADDALLLADAH